MKVSDKYAKKTEKICGWHVWISSAILLPDLLINWLSIGLYLFSVTQITQVAQRMLFKWAMQLGQHELQCCCFAALE